MAYVGLSMSEEDIKKIIAANICLGQENIHEEMKPYVWRRARDGHHVIDIKKFWDKLILAARVLVAIENPSDIACLSERPYGKRAVLKFAGFTGAQAIAGKYTPGTFTNQITKGFCEPRILVCQSPRGECQAICEASYMNMPVIAFCNTNDNLRNVDIAIPCNNNAEMAIGTCWWLLCRQLLKFRGKLPRHAEWDVMPDLFFYRNPDAEEEPEEEAPEVQAQVTDDWNNQDGAGLTEFPADQEFPEDWADVGDEFQPTAGGPQDAAAPNMPPQPQMGYPPQGDQGYVPQGGQMPPAQGVPQQPALPTSYFPTEDNLQDW